MPPRIDKEKCICCGVCASICPMQIFIHEAESGNPPEVRFAEECWHCLCCEFDCPQQAVTVRLPLPLMMPYVDAASLHGREGEDNA